MFGPRKNLNELFQSICEETVRMENLRVYLRVRPNLPGEVQQEEVCILFYFLFTHNLNLIVYL